MVRILTFQKNYKGKEKGKNSNLTFHKKITWEGKR